MFRGIVLLLVFCAGPLPLACSDSGPDPQVPELKVLDHYVGTWDVRIESDNLPLTGGESVAEWILDGRFVQQTGHLVSENGDVALKITTLMTYDQQRQAYRMWQFASTGDTREATGHWDAETNTLTSVQVSDNSKTTTTARFVAAGVEEWTIVTTNPQGEEVLRLNGRNVRRQP